MYCALLPEHCGHGYANEIWPAMLNFAATSLPIKGITSIFSVYY